MAQNENALFDSTFWFSISSFYFFFSNFFTNPKGKLAIVAHNLFSPIQIFPCKQIPDVSDMITSVHDLNAGNTIDSIRRSQHTLENLRDKINQTIYENIPQVKSSIEETGMAMRNISSEIERTLMRISNATSQTTQHFNTADTYYREYYIYMYYGLLAVCSTLLLVLMCIVCGLLCGICGKRPDGYGDDCCNKGAGARFLILYVFNMLCPQTLHLSPSSILKYFYCCNFPVLLRSYS